MIFPIIYRAPKRSFVRHSVRYISTLQSNPYIHIHPDPDSPSTSHILSLLSSSPTSKSLSIGTTTKLPPTPDSLIANTKFLPIVHSVIREYAHQDKHIQGQAAAFASSSGSALGSGGMFFPQQQRQRQRGTGNQRAGDGAGGASSQGGAGGGARPGFIHVSDNRAPPDYGRIAWPEDIFGSLEVDGTGEFITGDDGSVGNYQESGTYRIITREGILGLSDYLMGKLVERLREEEKKSGIPG